MSISPVSQAIDASMNPVTAGGCLMQTSLGPCPPAREVCPYKGCPVFQGLMCSNQGHCFEGKCHCAVDRSGPACEYALCDADDDCLDGQYCSDDHECSGGVAPPPTQTEPFSGLSAVCHLLSSTAAIRRTVAVQLLLQFTHCASEQSRWRGAVSGHVRAMAA